MKIIKILGIITGVILLYLIIIIFFPVLNVEKQPITKERILKETPSCRQDISFKVYGSKISGWLYLPGNSLKPSACIVLNNGFGGTKDVLLEKYALRFVEAGFAALTLDYRHFGESEGEPRQSYSIIKQLEDNIAAIEYVQKRDEIDNNRIFIWGTSSSGNFGLLIAAENQNIAGIIGQTASLDPEADGKMTVKREGIGWMLKLIMHAQKDKGRSRLGLSPHTIPIVGKPGSMAMLTAPNAFDGYQAIASESITFRNEVCARIMFESHGPNLMESAKKVNCPALFIICEKDNIIAPNSHYKIKTLLGEKATFINYPIGHFDIYFGDYFEKSIKEQIDFINNIFEN